MSVQGPLVLGSGLKSLKGLGPGFDNSYYTKTQSNMQACHLCFYLIYFALLYTCYLLGDWPRPGSASGPCAGYAGGPL